MQQRTEARKKGGFDRGSAARLRALVPPRLLPIFDILEASLREVHDGTLDPSRAKAMANISRALVSVLTADELEERLPAVEQKTGNTLEVDR